MKVWLFTLDASHTLGASAYTTEELATQAVDDWVQEWWEHELGDKPMPDDRNARIRAYFDAVEHENYNVECVTVKGTAP